MNRDYTPYSGKAPAQMGLGYIPDSNWDNAIKTREGWQRYADKLAKKKTIQDKGFKWTGTVSWIKWEGQPGYYRIGLGGMPFNLLTGTAGKNR